MSLRSENTATITRLFAKAKREVSASLQRGMESLLEAGVSYCLAAHDSRHQKHIETGDSYGWLLLRDGCKLSQRIYSADSESKGNAVRMLSVVKKQVSQSGYVGIVLAGMEPAAFYQVNYEFVVMRKGMETLSQRDFNSWFKRVVI